VHGRAELIRQLGATPEVAARPREVSAGAEESAVPSWMLTRASVVDEGK
jgi:hypothetical protein